jgi:hypothetical protein
MRVGSFGHGMQGGDEMQGFVVIIVVVDIVNSVHECFRALVV